MIFLDNKYTKYYYQIIINAIGLSQLRLTSKDYFEKHHVIPRSIRHNNFVVVLTAREHFICHWLLTKMMLESKHKKSMVHAFMKMCRRNKHQRGRAYPARYYSIARKNLSDFRTGMKHTDESKRKMSIARKRHIEKNGSHWLGKNHSEKTKQKISLSKRGENNPNFGLKRPEHAEKMRNVMKGRIFTAEHRKNLSKTWQNSRARICCEYCGITTTKAMNTRWHGDNCKNKMAGTR